MIFARPKLMLKFEVRKKIKEVTKEALEKAKEKEALDNIPSGGMMLGMKLAETAIDLVKTGAKLEIVENLVY